MKLSRSISILMQFTYSYAVLAFLLFTEHCALNRKIQNFYGELSGFFLKQIFRNIQDNLLGHIYCIILSLTFLWKNRMCQRKKYSWHLYEINIAKDRNVFYLLMIDIINTETGKIHLDRYKLCLFNYTWKKCLCFSCLTCLTCVK